jgi:hypothetical protein
LIPAYCSAYNLQESIPIFATHLTGPIFASCKVPIPYTMELIIDNCQLSKKQHRLEQNYGPQSSAQHRTLRGRKHIYKNIIGSDSGQEGCIFKCVQPARIRPYFCHPLNMPCFRFWQSPYSKDYGINYRQLPAIEKAKKQHRLEPNCGPQSRAQHPTLRPRKHIYKIVLAFYTGLDGCILKYVQLTYSN